MLMTPMTESTVMATRIGQLVAIASFHHSRPSGFDLAGASGAGRVIMAERIGRPCPHIWRNSHAAWATPTLHIQRRNDCARRLIRQRDQRQLVTFFGFSNGRWV